MHTHTAFAQTLLYWYDHNKRDLPWRGSKNPYHIWLSEVILQQTRVAQGRDYYHRFVAAFPTATSLANATQDEVMMHWQGLGYYSRARNLHTAAQTIRDQFGGEFPSTHPEILSLKGIGAYTAAAIASIAYGLPHAAVDGNVYRVLSRFYVMADAIDSGRGQRKFATLAQSLISHTRPGDYNQAVMELGALVCTPKSPQCTACPLQNQCVARHDNTIQLFPVKEKRMKITERYFHFLIIQHGNEILIRRRNTNDIWQGLYEFPLIESPQATDTTQLLRSNEWLQIFGTQPLEIAIVAENVKHQLTHRLLHCAFVHIKTATMPTIVNSLAITSQQLANYAFPQLIERHLEQIISRL